MDTGTSKFLAKAIGKSEMEKIPKETATKIEKYFDLRFEEFLKAKALYDTAQRDVEKLRSDYEKLCSTSEDKDVKIKAVQNNVDEMRAQLDKSKTDMTKLNEQLSNCEAEVLTYRKERNSAFDERDQLCKTVEGQNIKIDRLQADVSTLEQQLETSIAAKCKAIVEYEEIQSKEHNLDYKEKWMDKERDMLSSKILSLTDNLNKTMAELQSIRQENTLNKFQLETDLAQKTEENKVKDGMIVHLNETNQSLVNQTEDLSKKLKEQHDESTKMMEYYQKELQAQIKLADLYKVSSEDEMAHVNELKAGINELKKLLNETTEQYGELETKLKGIDVVHGKELEDRDLLIQNLRDELKNANQLLQESKDELIEKRLESLAPTAAALSKRIKTGMTLTEIYSLYVKAEEEAQLKTKECNLLEIQMKSIVNELEEKAPLLQKQNLEYKKICAANEELQQQLQNLIDERVLTREQLQEYNAKIAHLDRENKKLKIGQADLGRQVCFLLKEIEESNGGFVADSADQTISSDMLASEVISKKLVTFSDIVELQKTNEKLLLVVRDLSEKLEDLEEVQANFEANEVKIASYIQRLQDVEESREKESQLLATYIKQAERYKKLYYEIMKDVGKQPSSSDAFDGAEHMDGVEEVTPLASTSSVSSSGGNIHAGEKDKKIVELEDKLKETVKSMKELKSEYDDYRKEKLANDKILDEQFNSMRNEVREMTSTNCKLVSSVEYNNEQLKIQQKNISIYKKQIQALEERNKIYDNVIVKHEQTIQYLRDEAMNAHSKLSAAELRVEHLKNECSILKDNEYRFQAERQALYRERSSQNLLQNNLELIKATFERSENDGRIRMEQRLDEAQRECSALRRRLQEEQDHFRELAADIKREKETIVRKMEDEEKQAQLIRTQLQEARTEIANKSKDVDDLSKKLQESLTPSDTDNPIAKANKKAIELQNMLDQKNAEIEHYKKELSTSNATSQHYAKVCGAVENDLREQLERFEEEKSKLNSELSALRLSETNLKSRVDELQTEIRLQISGAQINTSDTTSQLNKVQNELKESLQKISENNRELRDLRAESQTLKASLQLLEKKYANEMLLHSGDIQALTFCKENLNKLSEESAGLKAERDAAVKNFKSAIEKWDESKKLYVEQKEELENRLSDLNLQNEDLHNQLQSLGSKLLANESLNDSISGNSLLDKSMNESDVHESVEQLLRVIKYLRKEKDIVVASLEVLKSENARLMSEASILQKTISDMNSQMVQVDRSSSDRATVSAAKHEEILRKLETLNAITDSNRQLREERDSLANRVKELSERISKVEDDLFPLQEKNRELQTKNEEQSVENQSLRSNVALWRKRATDLVERNNKNPEDFKRLQNERESLAKMLTAEKETLRAANEELISMKTERLKHEQELANVSKQCQVFGDEKKKLNEELNLLKQQHVKFNHEIIELKNSILQKEDELKKANDDLASKDLQLTDSKNKEMQIRKIAKRYKDSFFELKTKLEERDIELAVKPLEEQVSAANSEPSASSLARIEVEKIQKAKLDELLAQISAKQEEIEKLRKENDILKKLPDKDQLTEAKNRITSLTESTKQMTRELQTSKSQLQTCEQSRSEQDLLLTGLKAQFETRITRLERELSEQDASYKETIARLTRENDNFSLRINQLHRQLGMQQGSKPASTSGTIEKSPSDPTRTANVKPMAGPSVQQSATVNPRRGADTPLASIRPMSVQNSRTAAVLPTSQTSNVASVQGSTSASVTALVPPQQVHTTGSSTVEAMSSSPTSSHTDYMPATSSAVVVAVPPMGSTTAESSQEAESVSINLNESSAQLSIQQQTVALVSPRIEIVPQNIILPPQQSPQITDQSQAASTSGTSSSSMAVSTHHHASSSNTVTTTQAGGNKRQRENEGDSSSVEEFSSVADKNTQNKRIRIGDKTFQGLSESGLDVEYQVPTSSQRDQEDDNVIVVDSEEDDIDGGMVDGGTAEPDDGPFEEDADNGGSYEMDEPYDHEQDEDGEVNDIDEDNLQTDNNEVDIDDSSEIPNQSPSDVDTSQLVGHSGSGNTDAEVERSSSNQEIQQIQTISSGSEAGSSTPQTSWRLTSPMNRQQQQNLVIQQTYEETGDDSIVPSTPTLYVSRRSDGDAVSSPQLQVPHAARFTFSDSSSSSRAIMNPISSGDAIDEARNDINAEQINEGSRNVPSLPEVTKIEQSTHSDDDSSVGEGINALEQKSSEQHDAMPVPSDCSTPEIIIHKATENDPAAPEHDTSDTNTDNKSAPVEASEMDTETGSDDVTSEGEKSIANEGVQVEDDREAEATIQAPSSNTRSRTPRGQRRGGRSGLSIDQRHPITWRQEDQQYQHSMSSNTSRGQFQRSRRAKRRSYSNVRY